MDNIQKKLRKIGLIQHLASIKITVVCLSLLFVLTLWGTVAQVEQGLFLAQERYFNSWYFLAMGFLPFPGAQAVLWMLFVNLACVSMTRFIYKKSHLGIVIIHIGLLMYFVSAFVTFTVIEESNLTLLEGEGSNLSSAYHEWELAAWEEKRANTREIIAYDLKGTHPGDIFNFDEFGFVLTIESVYKNSRAYTASPESIKEPVVNRSGIKLLGQAKLEREPEKNLPGVILSIPGSKEKILLFGGESMPTSYRANGKTYNFALRRKRHQLPFFLTLDDFKIEMHPGTGVAKSYESFVAIKHDGLKRNVRIYMNHPLRYKNYTLYQASYSIDQSGRERSTLAVVKNSGRLLPYITSLITFLGLVIHFCGMAFRRSYAK